MMSNEMIECCVVALRERFKSVVSDSAGMPFEDTKVIMPSDEIWESYTRAAIAAMREPTEAMVNAACSYPNRTAVERWQQMIDEALR